MLALNLIKVARFVIQFTRVQRQFNDKFIDSYLKTFYEQYGKELKQSTLLKIKKGYCLASPLLSASYTKIYGRGLSEIEREKATLMGIFVPLVDDFTDDNLLDRESIDRLLFSPSDYNPKTLEEDIVMHINHFLLENASSAEGYLNTLRKVIDAQHWSKKQMERDVPRDELRQITLEKGGWSLVFWHYIIDEIPSANVEKILYLMGGIEQMCNDIFDVQKDFEEGIETFANTCDNYKEFKIKYTLECKEFVKLARTLPYRRKNLNFFITFNVFIMARGLVALQMLQKLQMKLGGGVLPIGQIDRKKMICDMEKPLNIFRMIKFAYMLQLI